LAQSRDANRLSDLSTMNNAINLYNTDQSGASTYSLGTASTTYISIADPAATSTAGTNCSTMGLPATTRQAKWETGRGRLMGVRIGSTCPIQMF
jgi:hypothetical protein